MKTKVAWRCQEIFFFCWMVSIYQKQVIHFFMGSKLAIPSQHFHRRWIKALSRQIQKFFCSKATTNAKNGSFQSISLCSYFSLAALNWSKSKGRIMCKENWVGRLSPNVFAQFTFFCNLLDPVPCINPKELQHTLSSTYILKSGKTNINYVWGQIYLPLWTVCWMCYHKTFLFFIRIW